MSRNWYTDLSNLNDNTGVFYLRVINDITNIMFQVLWTYLILTTLLGGANYNHSFTDEKAEAQRS